MVKKTLTILRSQACPRECCPPSETQDRIYPIDFVSISTYGTRTKSKAFPNAVLRSLIFSLTISGQIRGFYTAVNFERFWIGLRDNPFGQVKVLNRKHSRCPMPADYINAPFVMQMVDILAQNSRI